MLGGNLACTWGSDARGRSFLIEKYYGTVVPCVCAMSFLYGFFMWKCSFSFSPGKKLHRMCLCPESPGDHSANSGPAQSAPSGYCQNLPEWEWLCCFWEVWSNLQHTYPVPDISLHCYPYNSVRPAVSNHSNTEVRTHLWFFNYFYCACYHQCLCQKRLGQCSQTPSSLCILKKWIE